VSDLVAGVIGTLLSLAVNQKVGVLTHD
jgi:hypothetical protein